MNQYTIFIIVAPISTLLTLAVLLYAQVTYPSRETRLLSWLMASIMGWLIFNSLEVLAASETSTLLWAKITYIFIATTPLAWLAFALRYAGQERWLAWKRFAVLCIVPTLTATLALTNDWHMFLWEGYHYIPVDSMLAFKIDRGPWFYMHMLYSYSLTLTGAILILSKFIRSVSLYQKQSAWLAIGALTPIAVNIIYVSNIFPGLQKDYTPISFAVASMAFMFGMLRYRLFDLHPIARDMVINGLGDAVFVLDDQNRVIDANPAALNLLGLGASKVIGQPAKTVFAPWQELLDRFANETEVRTEISIGEKETAVFYDLRLSTLWDRKKNAIGRILVLREISQLKKTQQELLESNRMLDAYASAVAKDFKEPTNVILGTSRLLLERKHEAPKDSINYLIERIISNAAHLSSIVDSLLMLAQTDDENIGKITLTSVKLWESIHSVLDLHDTPVQLTNSDEDISVMAYQAWLEDLISNFLNTATQHTHDPETIKLEIEADQANQSVYLRLEYQGEEITNPTSKVKFMLTQRLAANMNCQANINRMGMDRWELSLKLPRYSKEHINTEPTPS